MALCCLVPTFWTPWLYSIWPYSLLWAAYQTLQDLPPASLWPHPILPFLQSHSSTFCSLKMSFFILMVLPWPLPPIFAEPVLSCHGGLSLHVPNYVIATSPKSSCFIFIIFTFHALSDFMSILFASAHLECSSIVRTVFICLAYGCNTYTRHYYWHSISENMISCTLLWW